MEENNIPKTAIDIINNIPDQIDNLKEDTIVFQRQPSVIKKEQNNSIDKAKAKANSLIDAALKIYVDSKHLAESNYFSAKANIDSDNLANIIHQVDVTNKAIDMLMESIEMGEINPKMYDALGKLQQVLVELIKAQNEAMRSTMNDLQEIVETMNDINPTSDSKVSENVSKSDSTVIASNTKDLLNMLNERESKNVK